MPVSQHHTEMPILLLTLIKNVSLFKYITLYNCLQRNKNTEFLLFFKWPIAVYFLPIIKYREGQLQYCIISLEPFFYSILNLLIVYVKNTNVMKRQFNIVFLSTYLFLFFFWVKKKYCDHFKFSSSRVNRNYYFLFEVS